MGIQKMTSGRRTSAASFFLALVGWFYLNQPIEAFGYQGSPIGARFGMGRLPMQGYCKDFTRSDCNLRVTATRIKNNIRSAIDCEELCWNYSAELHNNSGVQPTYKCKYFIYDVRYYTCSLFNKDLYEHEESCDTWAGPSMPSVANCDNPGKTDCLNMIEMDCTVKSDQYYIKQEDADSKEACQRQCLLDTVTNCKFFVYKKNKRECYLYTAKDMQCRSIRGSPRQKLQGCESVEEKLLKPTNDSCPPGLKINKEKVDCCCEEEETCCWSKCVSDRPPRVCIRKTKNSVWKKSDLGFYQGFQYKSVLSDKLTLQKRIRDIQTMNEAPQALQNLLWFNKYMQMQGKTGGNIDKSYTGKMSIFQ